MPVSPREGGIFLGNFPCRLAFRAMAPAWPDDNIHQDCRRCTRVVASPSTPPPRSPAATTNKHPQAVQPLRAASTRGGRHIRARADRVPKFPPYSAVTQQRLCRVRFLRACSLILCPLVRLLFTIVRIYV